MKRALLLLAWLLVGCTQNNYYVVCGEENEYSQAREEAMYLQSMRK